MKRLALVFGFTLSILPVYGAHEFVPIQDRAQGQALVGSNLLNDSIYSNPAASAFTQVYTLEGAYALPRTFEASVLDTKSSNLGAGLGYFRTAQDAGRDPMQGVKLAIMGKATDAIGLGVGGKLLWGPDNTGAKANLKDIDAGILVRLLPIHIGLTLRNLFGGNAGLNQVPEWGFGASVGIQSTLFLSSSVLGDMKGIKPYQYGFGLEYISQYYFSLKGGYRFQPDRNNVSFWTGGISFLAPKIAFHYSVEFPTEPGKKPEHLLGTTLQL